MAARGRKYTLHRQIQVGAVQEINGFKVRRGLYRYMGATIFPGGVNFVIHTSGGTSVELLFFHKGERKPYGVIPIPESYKIGHVYAIEVLDLDTRDLEYAYRVDGPYNVRKGLLFDKGRVLLDPYAKMIAGQNEWGKKNYGRYHGKVVSDDFDWGDTQQPKTTLSDLIIYEMHVRGFTKHESSGVKYPGTFMGMKEKIPYLKELGINAVELMPIFEFDECINEREYEGKRLLEYWGYNTVGFFAPNTSYCALEGGNQEGRELKQLIKELHKNGIEVILDVVFNHTAEGNDRGRFFSFKGFDNNIYYMLSPKGEYYNFSGCGNTMNCNHPVVQDMIVECLRYWVENYRVDGFRFDLASILGRNEDGSPMTNPPLLRKLAFDPLLANVKLIAEAWDAGGLYQVGSFPASGRWAEWNGRYRDTVRGYMKGDNWRAEKMIASLFGSEDIYGPGFAVGGTNEYAGYNSSINFVTCHDGFTLHDLYAYNEKHNEMNGWNNTDGSDMNLSWNCGVEGETDDEEIIALRHKMSRNAVAILFCSRGTPMFLAGDEFGNTQSGNNNSYCQDNEISWLDWTLLDDVVKQELHQFFKDMISFRKEHPVISRTLPYANCGMDMLTAYDTKGNVLDHSPEEESVVAVSFAGYNRETRHDDIVYVAINNRWQSELIHLPKLPNDGKWYVVCNTSGDHEGRFYYPSGEEVYIEDEFWVNDRSVAVFIAKF